MPKSFFARIQEFLLQNAIIKKLFLPEAPFQQSWRAGDIPVVSDPHFQRPFFDIKDKKNSREPFKFLIFSPVA